MIHLKLDSFYCLLLKCPFELDQNILTRTCSVNLIEFHHMFFGIFWFLSDYRRNIELFYFVLFCSILFYFFLFFSIFFYFFLFWLVLTRTYSVNLIEFHHMFFGGFWFLSDYRRNIELFYPVLFWLVLTRTYSVNLTVFYPLYS